MTATLNNNNKKEVISFIYRKLCFKFLTYDHNTKIIKNTKYAKE